MPDDFFASLADFGEIVDEKLLPHDEVEEVAAQGHVFPGVPMPTFSSSKLSSAPPLPPPSTRPPEVSDDNEENLHQV